MAPGSISYHISFQSTFICIFTISIYIIKYQKYIYLIILSLSDLTFASGREGIDNPFVALVASSLFVCVGSWDLWGASYWIDTLVLKKWGKYLCYCAASPSPLQGKPTQAQDVARRISGTVAGEVFAQVKTYQVPITNPSPSPLRGKPTQAQDVARRIFGGVAGEVFAQSKTYQVPITTHLPHITLFAIFLLFSSPPLHPCRFIRPLFSVRLSFSLASRVHVYPYGFA